MSVDEVEPIEAEAAEENAVATRGTHLASTQTVTHEYLTQSGKVMRETVRTDGTVTSVLDFIYDESGKPFAMIDQLSAQPKTYYYVLNLQGDVVKLVTESGAVAASYEYDAWGNILASSGSMAEKNPLRYRGYYYDSETGFYYLQSRYYDPATRRFINADALASTGQGFVGTNMFAYCYNNAINFVDNDGFDAIWIQEGNSAAGFGHSGLMVQDVNGSWYYFYWGPVDENGSAAEMATIGVTDGMIFEKVENLSGDLTYTDDVRSALRTCGNENAEERAFKITSTAYFKGDYTATFNYLQKLKNSPREKYHLLRNNCVQQSILAMRESDSRFNREFSMLPNNAALGVFAMNPPKYRSNPWSYSSKTHNYTIAS